MTTENNKIIAEFMNFPKVTNVRDSESGKYYDYQLPNKFDLVLEQEVQIESNNGWGLVKQDYVFAIDLIFHSDWNWLMEVVEKIESINFKLPSQEYGQYKAMKIKDALTMQYKDLTKIEATCNACVEFIKWYNEQNKV